MKAPSAEAPEPSTRAVSGSARALLYVWAGLNHVGTLLTIVAVGYFPVYLDSHAARSPGDGLPWLGAVLAGAVGPLHVALRRRRALPASLRARPLAAPLHAALVGFALWSAFSAWRPTGRVLWDAGPAWAGALYLVYWVLAGAAAQAVTAGRGLGYVSGCGQLLEIAQGVPPRAPELETGALYRYSRHPWLVLLAASVWITPVMTVDRFIWALLLWAEAPLIAGVEERVRRELFGNRFHGYCSRVPKWFAFRYKEEEGGRDAA